MNRVYIKGDAIGAARVGHKAMYVEGGGLTEAKGDGPLVLGTVVGVVGNTAYAVVGVPPGAFARRLDEALALDARGLVTRVAPAPGRHWGVATPRIDLDELRAHRVLYSLSPPFDRDGASIGLVVVSSTAPYRGSQVEALRGNARGPLGGTALAVGQGYMSHARLLRRMGYTIAGWPR